MTALLPPSPEKLPVFPKLSRRLRLGIVGGGRIATMQANAARLSNCWDVVAGALSSDPNQSIARGSQWCLDQERCYPSFDEMAEAERERPDGVDAVMITTPNHVHFASAKAMMAAGIDVLCDKPMTNEVSEADQLVELAGQSGCVFGVSYVMSCFPMVRQAREIVAAGTLGEINQIHVEFLQDWMIPQSASDADHVKWRLDPAKSGGTSCTGDIATHAAHLAQFVSGLTLQAVSANMHVCGSPKPLEDTVFMMTQYDNEIPGTLMATRLASGNRGGLRLRIFGSKGGLEWDLEQAERLKLSIFGQPDQILTRGHGHGISASVERLVRTGRGFPEGIIEAWANLYTEFAMAVAARRDGITIASDWLNLPSVEHGHAGVRFVDAALRSHQAEGAWIKI